MPGTTPKLGLHYPLATEAPDGPGGILQLATDVDNIVGPMPKPDMMCHAYWGNTSTDPTIVANGLSDVVNDRAVYDPYTMRQANGLDFKIPFAGRWSLYCRITFTASEAAGAGYSGQWANMTTGVVLGWQATAPVSSNTPVVFGTETILAKDALVRPRIFRGSTGAQWQRRYVDDSTRTESVLRYLGPN